MKLVQLQYPDNVPLSKVLDDLTVLSRNSNPQHCAAAAFAAGDFVGLRTQLVQRAVPVSGTITPMP